MIKDTGRIIEKNGWSNRLFSLCAIFVLMTILVCTMSGCGGKETKTEVASAPVTTPKPAPNIPPASSENDLLKIATGAEGTENKICYLTFDDGPTKEVTPAILDVLKKYEVKATFFMLGSMIEDNMALAKRVHKEGHLLANHSYSHNYGKLYATGESFMAEIEKAEELIEKVTGGESFKLVRFPGGSHNAGSYGAKKQQYKALLQEKGYYYADWNALNGDAEGSGNQTVEYLLSRVRETSLQQHIVVLMHDAAAKKTTADSLPAVIEYLKGQGYEFRRMDEIPYYAEEETEESQTTMVL